MEQIYYVRICEDGFDCSDATATPTPTPSNTPTITPSPTSSPTATATPNPVVYTTDNYFKDGSFETWPQLFFLGLSPWNSSWLQGTVNRYSSSPAESWPLSGATLNPLCGGAFQQFDIPPNTIPNIGQFDHTGVYTEQSFTWPGGDMFISGAVATSDQNTNAVIQMVKPDSTVAVIGPDVVGLTGWGMNFWKITAAPAGQYTLQVKGRTIGPIEGHIALDAFSVHEGYWVNDCGVPPELWTKDTAPAQAQVTATPGAPTATLSAAEMTSFASTRVYVGGTQSSSQQTATAQSQANTNATATVAEARTGTAQAIYIANGWQTATKIAQGVATLLAGGQGTQAVLTQTAQAGGLTATSAYGATSTAYVGGFRATLTAQAQATQTSAAYYATKNAGIYATYYAQQTQQAAALTATAARAQTQAAIPPVNVQGTLLAQQATDQARLLATNAAVLTQQAGQLQTAIAQASATVNATTAAQITQVVIVQVTLQVITTQQATQAIGATATAQASNQVSMPPAQPQTGIEAQCTRPDNVLNLPWWIDYEVCQVEQFFTFNNENRDQIQSLIGYISSTYQMQAFAQANDLFSRFGTLLNSYDWDGSMMCAKTVFNPLDFLKTTTNIFWGQMNLPLVNAEPYDPSTCNNLTMPIGIIVGPYIQNGMCFTIHILCITGIIAMLQYIFNTIMLALFAIYLFGKLQKLAGT